MASHAYAFDTYMYINKLKEAGFSEQQAKVQAETLVDIMDNNLVTKHDLEKVKLELKQDIEKLELRTDVKLTQLKNELIRWIFSMGAAQAAFVASLKLFH